MKTYFSLIAIAVFLLTACQKVVDADTLLDTEEEIFITGYIAPQDTVLRVNVTRALPSIGTSLSVNDQEENEAQFLIRDALVSISDASGNTTDLTYDEERKTYLADAVSLPILTDQEYFLKVIVAGNEYNATCKIPQPIAEINELITFNEDTFGNRLANINLSFEDLVGQRNFYVLGGRVSTVVQYEGEEPESFEFSLPFDSDTFLSDNLVDGGVLNGESETFISNDAAVLETEIMLQVANVEESLFQNLRATSTNADAEGNPFVEYAIAPNNFSEQGAIGVFAGYQLTEKVIQIEL